MSQLISQLLTLPFEKEALSQPASGQKVLIWGAEYNSKLVKIKNLQWIQNFKLYADILAHEGVETTSKWSPDQTYSIALCAIPKQKEAAKYRLARALSSLEDGGVLVAAAANDAGGKRLEKWFSDLGLASHSLSKSKCRVVWAQKENIDQENIDQYLKFGNIQKIKIEDKEFLSQPGVYGWNKTDAGSKFLQEYLPSDLNGVGGDFGCGYGYLSWSVLEKNPKIQKLYCLDADYEAVELCQLNLASYTQDIECLWMDLTQKPDGLVPLDWIVMNPPFHEGKETKNDIGQKFIMNAAHCLRRGGVLMMVANAHLPYEEGLSQFFSTVEKVAENYGFKVFQAIK